MDRAHSPIYNLLEQAACIARRSKEATGKTEPTESYKRGQTEELIKFADDNGLWIDLSHLNITYMDRADMKQALSGYLDVLFHQDSLSIGGGLPESDFYYDAE